MRLIDADSMKADLLTVDPQYGTMIWWCITVLDAQPTIEPERKTGKWIDFTEEGFVECPFCHSATNCDNNKDELHYCFSCGARMESE